MAAIILWHLYDLPDILVNSVAAQMHLQDRKLRTVQWFSGKEMGDAPIRTGAQFSTLNWPWSDAVRVKWGRGKDHNRRHNHPELIRFWSIPIIPTVMVLINVGLIGI